jgi:hypothetical protein
MFFYTSLGRLANENIPDFLTSAQQNAWLTARDRLLGVKPLLDSSHEN